MDKRTVTAFVLIFLVAFTYPALMKKFFPHLSPPEVIEETVSVETAEDSPSVDVAQKRDDEKKESAEKTSEEDYSLNAFEEKTYPFETEEALFLFSNRGGGIQSLNFNEYNEKIAFSSPEDYILNLSSFGAFNGLEQLEFTVSEQTGSRIVLSAVLDEKIKIEKIFEATEKKYLYDYRLRLTNITGEKYYMQKGPVVNAGTIFPNSGKKKKRYAVEEASAYAMEGLVERIRSKKIEGSLWMDKKYNWIGIQNTVFCFILRYDDKAIDGWNISKRTELQQPAGDAKENTPLQFEVVSSRAKLESLDIPAGESAEYSIKFYSGPKLYYHLASIGFDFKKIIDFGKMLAPIGRAIIWGLNKLYHIFHNYGICIIIITVIIKILLYPLTRSSMRSMKRMKELQPQMETIRAQYKDDPQKMNKEVMGLYKKNKVNPVGGCFPMLLQLPIFIALFKTLNNAVELKGASFLWISDLSAPDTIFHIGTFPVNILPLIMGLTQFISQKQTITDQKQAQMMYFMTVFFMFIFYSFPSGLVLYWLVSNLLSILQQSMINKSSS